MTHPPPLEGLRVVDAATLLAGPGIASIMGDFGADVVKVEHPRGDALRTLGWQKDGVSLWWLLAARNKRCITLNLSDARGQELLRQMLSEADVFIENFRPGTLERWGLAPDVLHELNPALVIVRVSGFGQDGPYSKQPGFGTLAEAMAGFAHINGWPDGPPTLPSFALADGVTALAGAFATMAALWFREHSGTGQVIDLSIYEPLFWLLGPQTLVYDQLGIIQTRTGNAAPFTSPRGAYQAKDGQWFGLSASSQSVAERLMQLMGREDIVREPWFRDHSGRLEHDGELDEIIRGWIGNHNSEEVVAAFAEHDAAIAPIYSIEDIIKDPHYQARQTITTIDHPQLGPVRMQNVIARLMKTPGRIRHGGMALGEHNVEILCGELNVSKRELEELENQGVV